MPPIYTLPSELTARRFSITSLGYNGVQLQSKLVWSPAKLIKIEKGQEYFKTALLEYLKVIPVDFDLVNASELSDEEQEKYLNY